MKSLFTWIRRRKINRLRLEYVEVRAELAAYARSTSVSPSLEGRAAKLKEQLRQLGIEHVES